MESIANLTKLRELKQQLADMKKAKADLPRLSQDDMESITDNYSFHLELNAEISNLRDEIADLERSGLGD